MCFDIEVDTVTLRDDAGCEGVDTMCINSVELDGNCAYCLNQQCVVGNVYISHTVKLLYVNVTHLSHCDIII